VDCPAAGWQNKKVSKLRQFNIQYGCQMAAPDGIILVKRTILILNGFLLAGGGS
jgi:hypothetical protein